MTTLQIADELVAETVKRTGLDTASEAVEAFLREQFDLKRQAEALDALWGSTQWEGDLEMSRLSRDLGSSDDHR